MSPSSHIRDRVVACAMAFAQLTGDTEEYRDLIAYDETPERQREMAQMSGCALTVSGIWRRCGIYHPSLDAPYVTQTAVSRLMALARKAGAVRMPMGEARLLPGDCVVVGAELPTCHVFTVVEALGPDRFLAVDGGQKTPDGFQLIEVKEHVWEHGHDRARRHGEPPGRWGITRPVSCWIDLQDVESFCLYSAA